MEIKSITNSILGQTNKSAPGVIDALSTMTANLEIKNAQLIVAKVISVESTLIKQSSTMPQSTPVTSLQNTPVNTSVITPKTANTMDLAPALEKMSAPTLNPVSAKQITQQQLTAAYNLSSTSPATTKTFSSLTTDAPSVISDKVNLTIDAIKLRDSLPATLQIPTQLKTGTLAQILLEPAAEQLKSSTQTPIGTKALIQVISDRALVAGDKLVLRQADNGELRLLGSTQKNTAELQKATADQLKEFIRPLPSANQKQEVQQTIIKTNLASVVPRALNPSNLLTALGEINQTLAKLPVNERQQWLSQQLQDSLKNLTQSIKTPADLSQPQVLKQQISTSGTQLEAQLKNLTQASSLQSNTMNEKNVHQKIEQVFASDRKAQLIQTTQAVESDIKTLLAQNPPAQLFAITQSTNSLSAPLTQLLVQLLGANKLSLKPQETLNLKAQVNHQIKQLAQHSLARIQLHQLQHLSRVNDQDNSLTQPIVQQEIPIRFGNEIHAIQLLIEREDTYINEEDDHKNSSSTALKQWKVLLTFDLDNIGELTVELRLLDKSLKTKLWINTHQGLDAIEKTQDRLIALLTNEGIAIEGIEIIHGKPPTKKMAINYALVDIKT